MKRLALASLVLYQKAVSPYMTPACRFTPTCSHYSYEAVSTYGVVKGGWLTLRRLVQCRPLGRKGYDPVP